MCAAVADCRGVDYTPEVIKDILLSGIYDLDVRREVMGTAGIVDKSVNDLVRIVKAKEGIHKTWCGQLLLMRFWLLLPLT